MDLIAGLPGEGIQDMQDTLRQIEELAPDSLTVHSLAIKRASKMGRMDLGKDHEKVSRTLEGMIEASREAADRMGLVPYYLYRQKNIAGNFENVGYAKVDKAGIYNILIMEEKQSIIAAGAGASTKIVLKEPVPMPGSKKKKMTYLMRIENVNPGLCSPTDQGYLQNIRIPVHGNPMCGTYREPVQQAGRRQ